MKKLKFPVFAIIGLSLFGCKDKPEQIPAYIKIQPFTVNAPGGADWQKLIYAWIYVNGEFLGAYSPGSEVPFLAEGESDIVVFPGINANGLQESPEIYPFLTRFDTKLNLVPGETVTLVPETKYDPATIAPWNNEGEFESPILMLENLDDDAFYNISYDANGAYFGRSARMQVDTAHDIMLVATPWVTDLPTSGDREVWLEMNYKNDTPFQLFLESTDDTNNQISEPFYYFQPKDQWNKIYFNLTAYLRTDKNRFRFSFLLSIPRDNAGKFTSNSGNVQFDNLRLLHF